MTTLKAKRIEGYLVVINAFGASSMANFTSSNPNRSRSVNSHGTHVEAVQHIDEEALGPPSPPSKPVFERRRLHDGKWPGDLIQAQPRNGTPNSLVYRDRCRARMPCSNPSRVSGYMRSPISSRTIWIEGT